MRKEFIDYSALVDDAMHLIVKKSLMLFAENSHQTDHHFFISFITKFPGVEISDRLRLKYPYEMTIVLQFQYEDLKVEDELFSVVLSFDGKKETIVIPFSALTAFADPSVKFGLQFRHIEEGGDSSQDIPDFSSLASSNKAKSKSGKSSVEKKLTDNNIIKLDFKNKKLQ